MKIEIGESLIRSWLRHVIGCQVAELNWKPSPSWRKVGDADAEAQMAAAREFFLERGYADVFKKNQGATQLLKQAEIDVFGVRFERDLGNIEVYAVDVALHLGGLNYGDNKETASRVIKKLLRSLLLFNFYFSMGPLNLAFASPTVGKTCYEGHLKPAFDVLQQFVSLRYPNCKVNLIMNGDFTDKIFNETIKKSSEVADTSELFLRAYQMLSQQTRKEEKIITMNQSIPQTMPRPTSVTLPISMFPSNEERFLDIALKSGRARIVTYYMDGKRQEKSWEISKLTSASNLKGNLRSRPEFRQGEWQKRGIERVEVEAIVGEVYQPTVIPPPGS